MMNKLWQYAKGRRENIFMLFLVGSVASELMWIIRIRNDREVIANDTQTQIKVMDRIISRLKAGESVDIKYELMKKEETEFDDILSSIQELDLKWREETAKKTSGDAQPPAVNEPAQLPKASALLVSAPASTQESSPESAPISLESLRAPKPSSSKFL